MQSINKENPFLVPGQKISSLTHPDKGPGTVIEVKSFAGASYADIFFERTGEKLSLPTNDLSVVDRAQDKIKAGIFSPAAEFVLRLFAEQIKASSTREELQSTGGFKILPLPHQLLAVSFVLDQFKPRVLIADEVGLGKTIEAALIYEELKARGMIKRVLVVAPSGLCRQWQMEMGQKFSEEFALFDHQTVNTLRELHGRETNVWTLNDRIITSIDFIKPKKIGDELEERSATNRERHNTLVFDAAVSAGFDMVIFDEAQKLSKDTTGEETARYKVAKAMADSVPIFCLLSATPHQGDSARFKNLLNLIDPYLFLKQNDVAPENVRKVTIRHNKRAVVDFQGRRIFKKRVTSLLPIERDPVTDKPEIDLYEAVSRYVSEFYDLAKSNNDRTMMFLLLIYQRMVSSSSRAILKSLRRRLETLQGFKAQILDVEQPKPNAPDIDAPWEQMEDMSAEEQLDFLENRLDDSDYCRYKDQLEIETQALENVVSLAQLATSGRNDVKFTKLLEVIDEFKIRENNPKLKFIIFTEFIETQNYLNDCLSSLGYTTALINGRMSPQEKEEQKTFFKERAQFLISTDAGGEGINLQFCWVLINYDLPWNPMRLEQRIGRLDRIGQEHDVKVINFEVQDSVEQRVREVIENKLELVKQEFNDGEDKLADILSTLQTEFNFENIYLYAIQNKGKFEEQLNRVGQELYEKAKDIIRNGELALPFNDLQQEQPTPIRDIEKMQGKLRAFVNKYLELHNRALTPHKKRRGVYYFNDPKTGKRISRVIFDQKLALKNDDCELFGLNHQFIKDLFEFVQAELTGHVTGKLQIHGTRFKGQKGVLVAYRLCITNNIDPCRQYVLPVFVDMNGKVNKRISRIFDQVEEQEVTALVRSESRFDMDTILTEAGRQAEEEAETIFLEYQTQTAQTVAEIEKKLGKFYEDKERSIRQMAIENIRRSKLDELVRDKEDKAKELKQKKQLVPNLECLQIALVEFV